MPDSRDQYSCTLPLGLTKARECSDSLTCSCRVFASRWDKNSMNSVSIFWERTAYHCLLRDQQGPEINPIQTKEPILSIIKWNIHTVWKSYRLMNEPAHTEPDENWIYLTTHESTFTLHSLLITYFFVSRVHNRLTQWTLSLFHIFACSIVS